MVSTLSKCEPVEEKFWDQFSNKNVLHINKKVDPVVSKAYDELWATFSNTLDHSKYHLEKSKEYPVEFRFSSANKCLLKKTTKMNLLKMEK